MKTFFFLLISLNAYSSDCISKAGNTSLGIKMHSILKSDFFGDSRRLDIPKDVSSLNKYCSSNEMKQYWINDRDSKAKLTKIIHNDFKTKGKSSSSFLYYLDEVPENKEITDAEICHLVDKNIKIEIAQCFNGDEAYLKSLSSINFLNMNFEDACRKMVPMVKEAFEASEKCHESMPKKDNIVKRDPPGEEISPADDSPPQVRAQILRYKTREQVKDFQPAKVKFSSGVSRQ